MKTTFSILLVLLSAVSYAQRSDSLVRFQKSNYSISYPAGWKLDTTQSGRQAFTIFSPAENFTDKFSENILLYVIDLEDDTMSLDVYVDLNEKDIKQNAPDLQNFSSIKLRSAAGDFYKLTYDFPYQVFRVNTVQYYIVRNNTAYILNFSSEKGHMKETGEKIMNSFTFNN